ncbi:hypothetical protein ERO13_A06G089500v2 [Gossypium hirsutum]|uniref:GATA transcription factor 22 n=3 Tax=Gossypium TaxID=3633 RepID=A0ABM3BX89_GOSHI|nr:putative GATA transcription factor 22 [Gossypium hirsutum]KAG4195057.1 hypothetical protein ERO13_A06G089500v2 [Gossypium hirsutum]PPS03597.1 hypothetical protein GOBAR_AA17064 [Gossypium barbadense]TYH12969.1 hypothetical protein ES288_A06G107700v1 [Gossypium darwinii]
MTPAFLNPPPSPNFPFVELKEEPHHLQLFLSVNKYEGGSSASDQQASSSSSSSSLQSTVEDQKATNAQNSSFGRNEERNYESSAEDNKNGITVKWMSSKMRLMKKMMNSNSNCSSSSSSSRGSTDHKFQYPVTGNGEANAIRVCSDCNTTTTPLWRSGPRGPKSLCNACGIRQRKARRAMEAATVAAESGAGVATDAAILMKFKENNKEKKSRIGQFKKQQFKAQSDYNSPYSQQSQKKLYFKELASSLSKNSALQSVFPRDVEDAAILLMELSCGLIHS